MVKAAGCKYTDMLCMKMEIAVFQNANWWVGYPTMSHMW